MTTQMAGYEMQDSEDYLGPRMYRIRFCCDKCGHEWVRTLKAIPKKDPPCPNKHCGESERVAELQRQVENLTRMLEERKPPPQTGRNKRVKAIDTTAEIVMQDYQLTNLKDRAEPGESLAPKLPPEQQKQADSYFTGDALKSAGVNKKQMDLLGKRAIAGAFRNMAVPPSTVINQDHALKPLRVEPLNKK